MNGVLLATSSEWMNNRVFELDFQMIVDALIMAAAIFVLFLALSYLLFNPARNMLKKRRDFIKGQLDDAARDKREAADYKTQYDSKLKNVNKEAEGILSEARKKAIIRENEIIDDAKEEASRIIDRAGREVELEKVKVKDEMKQEMIAVAQAMAGKIVNASLDEQAQAELIDDTLKEMGDETWQS